MGTLPNAVEITKVGSIMCSGMCAIPFTHVNFVLRGNNLRLLFANIVVDCNIVVDRKKNVMVHIIFKQLIFIFMILSYSITHIYYRHASPKAISIEKSAPVASFFLGNQGENSPDITPSCESIINRT